MAYSSKSVCETRNWADMPRELLGMILNMLILIPDYVRFGAVCKSWQLVKRDQQQERNKSCHRQPMLVIPSGDDGIYHPRLYSIWEQKLYPHRLQIPFARRCSGSSYGWWAFAERENDTSPYLSVTLLNPFSGEKICLPTIMKIPDTKKNLYDPEHFIHKVILSCDPCLYPEDWVAVAIHRKPAVLAFIRAGESSWTYPMNNFFPVKDACFYQGQLYVVNGRSELVSIDLLQQRGDGTSATTTDAFVRSPIPVVDGYSIRTYSVKPEQGCGPMRTYLVELGQDLLIVRRYFHRVGELLNLEKTTSFWVQKLCRKKPYDSENSIEWVDVTDLGNFSLLLGDTESISVSAYDFPHCKPDCIYYIDDCWGIYSAPYEVNESFFFRLETGEIISHYTLDLSKRYMPPLVWISPKLGAC